MKGKKEKKCGDEGKEGKKRREKKENGRKKKREQKVVLEVNEKIFLKKKLSFYTWKMKQELLLTQRTNTMRNFCFQAQNIIRFAISGERGLVLQKKYLETPKCEFGHLGQGFSFNNGKIFILQ